MYDRVNIETCSLDDFYKTLVPKYFPNNLCFSQYYVFGFDFDCPVISNYNALQNIQDHIKKTKILSPLFIIIPIKLNNNEFSPNFTFNNSLNNEELNNMQIILEKLMGINYYQVFYEKMDKKLPDRYNAVMKNYIEACQQCKATPIPEFSSINKNVSYWELLNPNLPTLEYFSQRYSQMHDKWCKLKTLLPILCSKPQNNNSFFQNFVSNTYRILVNRVEITRLYDELSEIVNFFEHDLLFSFERILFFDTVYKAYREELCHMLLIRARRENINFINYLPSQLYDILRATSIICIDPPQKSPDIGFTNPVNIPKDQPLMQQEFIQWPPDGIQRALFEAYKMFKANIQNTNNNTNNNDAQCITTFSINLLPLCSSTLVPINLMSSTTQEFDQQHSNKDDEIESLKQEIQRLKSVHTALEHEHQVVKTKLESHKKELVSEQKHHTDTQKMLKTTQTDLLIISDKLLESSRKVDILSSEIATMRTFIQISEPDTMLVSSSSPIPINNLLQQKCHSVKLDAELEHTISEFQKATTGASILFASLKSVNDELEKFKTKAEFYSSKSDFFVPKEPCSSTQCNDTNLKHDMDLEKIRTELSELYKKINIFIDNILTIIKNINSLFENNTVSHPLNSNNKKVQALINNDLTRLDDIYEQCDTLIQDLICRTNENNTILYDPTNTVTKEEFDYFNHIRQEIEKKSYDELKKAGLWARTLLHLFKQRSEAYLFKLIEDYTLNSDNTLINLSKTISLVDSIKFLVNIFVADLNL